MRLFCSLALFFLLSGICQTYPQAIKIGISGGVLTNFSENTIKYNFTQNGEIDKTNQNTYINDIGNFNSIGVLSTILFNNNFVTGLEISYGEKNIWDISLGDNFYTKTNFSLLSLSVPLYYHYKFDDDYFLEVGINVGFAQGKYCEEYNIRNTNTGNYEDKNDTKNEYTFQLTPQLSIGTKIIYPFEPELFLSYALTSKFNYEDFRFVYIDSIEYNFNGLSIGLKLNYVFKL